MILRNYANPIHNECIPLVFGSGRVEVDREPVPKSRREVWMGGGGGGGAEQQRVAEILNLINDSLEARFAGWVDHPALPWGAGSVGSWPVAFSRSTATTLIDHPPTVGLSMRSPSFVAPPFLTFPVLEAIQLERKPTNAPNNTLSASGHCIHSFYSSWSAGLRLCFSFGLVHRNLTESFFICLVENTLHSSLAKTRRFPHVTGTGIMVRKHWSSARCRDVYINGLFVRTVDTWNNVSRRQQRYSAVWSHSRDTNIKVTNTGRRRPGQEAISSMWTLLWSPPGEMKIAQREPARDQTRRRQTLDGR